MNLFGREIEGYKQWFALFVTVLLVASGLCGVQWAIVAGAGGRLELLVPVFMVTGVAELILMALSAGGVIVVLILWPIANLYNRYAKQPEDDIQRLLDDAVTSKEEQSKESSNEEPNDR